LQTLMQHAANGRYEPKVSNAARRAKGGLRPLIRHPGF